MLYEVITWRDAGRVATDRLDAPLGPPQGVITSYSIHYTKLYEDMLFTNPGLAGLDDAALRQLCAFCSVLAPGVVMQTPTIRSATGQCAEGVIIALPLLPESPRTPGLVAVNPPYSYNFV